MNIITGLFSSLDSYLLHQLYHVISIPFTTATIFVGDTENYYVVRDVML